VTVAEVLQIEAYEQVQRLDGGEDTENSYTCHVLV
jgi:hypothetical protein